MSAYLLRTSEAASLALHAAAYLAGHAGGRLSSREIADGIQAPHRHLEKILALLTRARLLRAKRGPGRGFTLARPPGTIWLREVYEAIVGQSDLGACSTCGDADDDACPISRLWYSVDRLVAEYLSTTTLADLTAASSRRRATRSVVNNRLRIHDRSRPGTLASPSARVVVPM